MSSPPPSPLRTSSLLGALRFSLLVGAVYDLVLAVVLLVRPSFASGLLGVPLPSPEFYLWLIAVLLVMLSLFYLLAAYDPMAYAGNVLVAILARGAAGAVLAWAALRQPELAGLFVLAGVDLLFAAVHAVCWFPIRRSRAQLW